MGCFNRQCVDVDYIGALLPRLIVFPEGNNFLRMKIEAASSVFVLTWKEPVPIEKNDDDDDDDDDGAPDIFNWAFPEMQQDEDYTDPSGCLHEELLQFRKNIVKCLPVTLGFFQEIVEKVSDGVRAQKRKGWRENCNVGGSTEEYNKGSMTPEGLLQHLNSKKKVYITVS